MWEQLLKAAKDGSVEELVVALTERNVNIDTLRDNNGWTALMIAAFWGRTRIVIELLLSGANLVLENANGNTAERIARNGNQHAVRLFELLGEGKANDGEAKAFAAKLLEKACANKFSDESIRYLGELCPGAVETMAKTFTLRAVVTKKFPAICVQWIVLADPNAIKANGDKKNGDIPLHFALMNKASEAVVTALLAAWPDAVEETDKHGYTSLRTNTVCFTLVEKRASLTATNALGQTPAEASQDDEVADEDGTMVKRKYRHHLIASFREIAAYKKRTRLSVMHFRDWTTVSHAWCTPSAKLVALTVLMVGETYKRGLLPRLPMDCWYFILNCIPRHELRLGGCEPAEEQDARTKYLAILQEARARVDAADAAGNAASEHQKELDALIAKRDALNVDIDALTRKYDL